MVYPMPLAYDDERIERRDYEYMKSLYPEAAKQLLPYVEQECDRYEYPFSMIFDEYPDRLQLRLMSARIYHNVQNSGEDSLDILAEQQENQVWIQELIEVMLYQELYKRRSDDRREKRKFY